MYLGASPLRKRIDIAGPLSSSHHAFLLSLLLYLLLIFTVTTTSTVVIITTVYNNFLVTHEYTHSLPPVKVILYFFVPEFLCLFNCLGK